MCPEPNKTWLFCGMQGKFILFLMAKYNCFSPKPFKIQNNQHYYYFFHAKIPGSFILSIKISHNVLSLYSVHPPGYWLNYVLCFTEDNRFGATRGWVKLSVHLIYWCHSSAHYHLVWGTEKKSQRQMNCTLTNKRYIHDEYVSVSSFIRHHLSMRKVSHHAPIGKEVQTFT